MDSSKINPLDELVFKKLFSNEEGQSSLISLLDSILNLEGDKKIHNISKIENKQMKESRITDKRWILGIEAYTVDESRIDIEIQLTDKREIVDTALICLSRLCVDLKDDEFMPKRSVLIIFLDYEYSPGEEFHTVYHFRDDKNNNLLSDSLELHFIEIPKFQKINKDVNIPLHRWMVFLDNLSSEEAVSDIKELDEDVKKAAETLKNIMSNSDFMNIYNLREKIINEYYEIISDAEENGMQKGLKIGKKDGIELGAIKAYREIILDILRDYGPISKELGDILKNNCQLSLLKEWYAIARFSTNNKDFMNQI